jgi:hypothetical protein
VQSLSTLHSGAAAQQRLSAQMPPVTPRRSQSAFVEHSGQPEAPQASTAASAVVPLASKLGALPSSEVAWAESELSVVALGAPASRRLASIEAVLASACGVVPASSAGVVTMSMREPGP